MGARHVQVFVDKEKVFDGEVEKGCGNHVFDYSKTIPVTDKNMASPTKALSPSLTKDRHKEASSHTKGNDPPHSPLPANSTSLTQRGVVSPLKGGNPSVPNDGHHHTFRSISRSSASSASSSGSHPSRPSSQNDERGQIRSETRAFVRPTMVRQQSTGSDRSSPEAEKGNGTDFHSVFFIFCFLIIFFAFWCCLFSFSCKWCQLCLIFLIHIMLIFIRYMLMRLTGHFLFCVFLCCFPVWFAYMYLCCCWSLCGLVDIFVFLGLCVNSFCLKVSVLQISCWAERLL